MVVTLWGVLLRLWLSTTTWRHLSKLHAQWISEFRRLQLRFRRQWPSSVPRSALEPHICAAVTRDPHADSSLRVVITELFQTGLPAVLPCSILLRSAPFRSIPCHRLSPIATTVAFDSKSIMMEPTGLSLFTVTSVNSNTVKCATMAISTC